MSKKFKIAQNPTFKAVVQVPRIGESDIAVPFEFKYRPRSELAKMYDEWKDYAVSLEVKEDATFSEVTKIESDIQVRQIKDVVVGWDFEDEFNEDAIRELIDGGVNVSQAILAAFQNEYTKSKVGN